MHKNIELYNYLATKTEQLSEEWYKSIDKSTAKGIYASTDLNVIKKLKGQNLRFHEQFIKIFIEDENQFSQEFESWVQEISQDSDHLMTPTHTVLDEFLATQCQYMQLLEEYALEYNHKYTMQEILSWGQIVNKAFGEIMSRFVEAHHSLALTRLTSQQAVINELSAPVIKLHQGIGLLPVIGDIDTQRAKYLLEHTLMECSRKKINHLYVDLSGVTMIDTMVAMQIFQLIDSLKIVGVNTTLSGVRPEIALTAVQLGINFKEIQITGNLSQALQLHLK